jgi:hypothetical protein
MAKRAMIGTNIEIIGKVMWINGFFGLLIMVGV